MAVAHQERLLADKWINKILLTMQGDAAKVILVVADMAKKNPVLSGAFVAEMTRRLTGQSNTLALSWVEQHLLNWLRFSVYLADGSRQKIRSVFFLAGS